MSTRVWALSTAAITTEVAASLSLKAALEPLTWIMTAGIVLIIGGVLLIEVGSAAS